MKKQGKFYLTLISILLAALLAVYVLCSFLLRGGADYRLKAAVYCEVGDGITVSGFAVRSEKLLSCSAPYVSYEAQEGARVSAGQTVATGYESSGQLALRTELSALQAQQAQLFSALKGESTQTAVSDVLLRLSEQTARQNFIAMRTCAGELAPLVLAQSLQEGDAARITARLSNLETEIEAKRDNLAQGTAVKVANAGYFSRQTDGLEDMLTPEVLQTLTLRELHALKRDPSPENAVGRLIFGQCWYFVTEIPAARAADCGERLTVRFSSGALRELNMEVTRIGAQEDGQCLLVLSCNEQLQNVTALRELKAELRFQSYQGLRVPKDAIYYNGSEAGVYILEGACARWKKANILYDCGNDLLVEWDGSDTDNLWPNDLLILTEKEIKNGSVITE